MTWVLEHGIADTFDIQVRSPYVFYIASACYEIEQSLWIGSMESWRQLGNYCT